MNEQLQTALTDILEKTMSGVDAATEFLVEETPLVIQELLTWYSIVYFLEMLFAIGIFIVVTVNAIKWMKYIKKDDADEDAAFAWFLVSGIASAVAIIIAFTLFNIKWLQILIAPKIWLIEYASKLVN